MFERKTKAQVVETGRVTTPGEKFPAGQAGTGAPKIPTVLERLRKKRAEMIAEANHLDKEIEKLDHDITFVERHPMSAHVLEFIAARFGDELQPATEEPWRPGRDRD